MNSVGLRGKPLTTMGINFTHLRFHYMVSGVFVNSKQKSYDFLFPIDIFGEICMLGGKYNTILCPK